VRTIGGAAMSSPRKPPLKHTPITKQNCGCHWKEKKHHDQQQHQPKLSTALKSPRDLGDGWCEGKVPLIAPPSSKATSKKRNLDLEGWRSGNVVRCGWV